MNRPASRLGARRGGCTRPGIVAACGGRRRRRRSWTATQGTARRHSGREFISAPELAGRIMRGDRDLRLFDLRPAGGLRAVPHSERPSCRRQMILLVVALAPETDVVLYGDDRDTLSDALRGLRATAPSKRSRLREGIFEWLGRVHEPRLAVDATPAERAAVRARGGDEPFLRRRAPRRCATRGGAAGILDGHRRAATSC